MADSPPLTPTVHKVPIGTVFLWTAPWVAVLLGLLIAATFTKAQISYSNYQTIRAIVALLLVGLAVVGILRALELVGTKDDKPWYTIGFLVALVLFWGLCPPTWFFTEYYLFDQGTLALPDEMQKKFDAAKLIKDQKAMTEIQAPFLSATKIYADLASKIWVAVGAALATTIGFAKK